MTELPDPERLFRIRPNQKFLDWDPQHKLAAACLLLTDGGGIEHCNFHFFSTQAAAEIYF